MALAFTALFFFALLKLLPASLFPLSCSSHYFICPASSRDFSPSPPSPPPPCPLAVVEAVSVMAVGRLPAAGEILINSLFICVERGAPAF